MNNASLKKHSIAVPPNKKPSAFVKNLKKYGWYYAIGLPGLLILFIYRYLPMGGLIIAFKDYHVSKGIWGSEWVGLKWFEMLFINGDFAAAFTNTLVISMLKLLFYFPVPIILALLMNELANRYYRRVVQTIIYLPHFISWAILAGIMFTLLSPQMGILGLFGIKESPLLDGGSFRWLLVFSEVWKDSGWGTIIYLAAISSIDPSLYEAATIDGASRFQRVLYITLPSIAGTFVVLLILKMGHILNAGFNQVYMLYNPNVMNVADILDTYIFRIGISNGRFSLATAGGLFKSVIGLIMVLMTNRLAKIFDPDAGII